MNWKFLKAFPKFVVVFGVLIVSTGLFCAWWWLRPKPSAGVVQTTPTSKPAPEIDHRWETLPDRIDKLFLADGDLLDAETGDLIYKNWLHGDKPVQLFYQADQKKVVGRFERGFQRYALDGTKEEMLTERYGAGFSFGLEQAAFARDGDLWIAEVDWQNFKFINERRVTKVGNLQESFMIQNIRMGSDKFILLRNANQMLRINLSSGEVAPSKFGREDIPSEGRSPDGTELFTMNPKGELVCYNIDTDTTAVRMPFTNARLIYGIWTDRYHALGLIGGTSIITYDRKNAVLAKNVTLPEPCNQLESPSPAGRYVFAKSRKASLLVDTKEKKILPFEQSGQHLEWISDDTMLIAYDIPDSKLRGTWLLKIGDESKRVLDKPYNFSRDGTAAVLVMKDAGWVVLGAGEGLFRMNTDGKEVKEFHGGPSRAGVRMLGFKRLEL